MIICTRCGNSNGPREISAGRCGKCGSFFSGEEQQAPAEEQLPAAPTLLLTGEAQTAPRKAFEPVDAPPDDHRTTDDGVTATTEGPREAAPAAETPPTEPLSPSSESLVLPRKLSPQFRKHIERAWKSTLGGAGSSVAKKSPEHTLSSSSADTNKEPGSRLRIGTRRLAPPRESQNGDYVLNRVIGEGNMGRVWLARQTSLDRDVALKIPRSELADAGSLGETQFISEVVVTGKLEHPNIVPIYDLGRDASGNPFYSMKHVVGQPWNELIAEKSEQENLEILMKVCDAIAFAHDRDFLHRDIKPHNVMVGEFGEVSVMDWGIAVSLRDDPDQPWAAVAEGPAGTPAYMAPEMAAHNPSELGVVSDVYLLGAVLYEIVAGTPPHPRTGDTGAALLSAAANEIVTTDRKGELIDIARRAMATQVSDRYQSVPEFQEALREYQSHRESITLTDSALAHVAQAKGSRQSDEYARARFAFEEAIKLWSGNHRAHTGLREATLAYATAALEQGNYELGLSILDPDDPEHRSLRSQLQTRRRARDRRELQIRLLSYSVVLLITVLAAGGILAGVYLNEKRNEAEDSARNARIEKRRAEDSRAEAQRAKVRAQAERATAVAAEAEAEQERVFAVQARNLADSAKHRAEVASYRSDIGLAAESLRRNAFLEAKEITDDMKQGVKASLRHWEWGYLEYLQARSPRSFPGLQSGEQVAALAVAGDGSPADSAEPENARLLIAAATSRGVRLWISRDSGVVTSDEQLAVPATAVALDPTGTFLIAAIRESQPDETVHYALKRWTVNNGKLADEVLLAAQPAHVHSLAISTDGKLLLAASADRAVRLWDLPDDTGQELPSPKLRLTEHSGVVWQARFSPDLGRIVTACDDGRVRVWNTTGEQLADFAGHQGPVYAAEFIDDTRIVSGGEGRRLIVWQATMTAQQFESYRVQAVRSAIADNAQMGSPYAPRDLGRHDASIRCIRVAPAGQFVVSGSHDNSVRIWDPTSDTTLPRKILRGHGRWVRACAIAPDGQRVLSGGFDGAKLWNWQAYTIPQVLAASASRMIGDRSIEGAPPAVTEASVSPDGQWVASSLQNGSLSIWNLRQPARSTATRLEFGHRFLASNAVFFDEGRGLLTAAGDDTVRLWDVERGIESQVFEGTGWRGVADITSDGTLVLTGSDQPDQPVRLFQRTAVGWQTIKFPGELESQRLTTASIVALAEDGQTGFAADANGRCVLFSIDSEQSLATNLQFFTGHNLAVTAASFLPDSTLLLTGGDDGVLRSWRVPDGQLLQERPLSGPIASLAISADGQQALVACQPVVDSATPHPWNVPAVQLLNIQQLQDAPIASLQVEQLDAAATKPPVVQSVNFAPQDSTAVLSVHHPSRTGAARQTVALWDWQSNAAPATQSSEQRGWGDLATAQFRSGASVNGELELLTVGSKGAKLWSVSEDFGIAPMPKAVFEQPPTALNVAFSTDSRRLVSGGSDGLATVSELRDGAWAPMARLGGRHSRPVLAVDFDPRSSDRLLTASLSPDGTEGQLVVWEFDQAKAQWRARAELDSQNVLLCAQFLAAPSDDETLIVAGGDNGVRVWKWSDLVANRLAGAIVVGTQGQRVQRLTAPQDGNWLATANGSLVSIWDAANIAEGQVEKLAQLSGHAEMVTGLAFSQDRRRLLTGSDDKTVKLWDTHTLLASEANDAVAQMDVKAIMTLEHDDAITSVVFTADGRNVVTAGKDGRAIVWAGEAVPPSLHLPAQVSLEIDQPRVSLSAGGVAPIQAPTRVDFSQCQLTIRLEERSGTNGDSQRPAEELASRLRFEATPALWEVQSAGNSIVFRPAAGVQADLEAFQQLLRSMHYQHDRSLDALAIRRTNVAATFELQGVRFGEWDPQLQEPVSRPFPEAARAEVIIEIATDLAEVALTQVSP